MLRLAAALVLLAFPVLADDITGKARVIDKKPDPKARRVLQGGTRGALGKRKGGEPSGMIIEP